LSPSESFVQYWWFHIPNLLMAALIYTLIGRYLLELVLAKQQDAVILRVFRTVTDWFVRIVRFVTPAVVPNGLTVVFAIMWLIAARMLWLLAAVMFGMRPGLGGG
jgi:hypothetical protein